MIVDIQAISLKHHAIWQISFHKCLLSRVCVGTAGSRTPLNKSSLYVFVFTVDLLCFHQLLLNNATEQWGSSHFINWSNVLHKTIVSSFHWRLDQNCSSKLKRRHRLPPLRHWKRFRVSGGSQVPEPRCLVSKTARMPPFVVQSK